MNNVSSPAMRDCPGASIDGLISGREGVSASHAARGLALMMDERSAGGWAKRVSKRKEISSDMAVPVWVGVQMQNPR